jgi:hypothetical protein
VCPVRLSTCRLLLLVYPLRPFLERSTVGLSTMRRSSKNWAVTIAPVALVALVAIGAAACGSTPSGKSPSTSTSTSTSTTTVAQPSKDASQADIKGDFSTLFDLSNPAVTPKLAVIQDGSSIRLALTKELTSSLAKQAKGAIVSSIKIETGSSCRAESLASPCALVTYSIVSPSGAKLLPNAEGYAVYLPPKWYVSKDTICTLLTFANGNKTPAGC